MSSFAIMATVLALGLLSDYSPVNCDLPPPAGVPSRPSGIDVDNNPPSESFEEALAKSFGIDPNFNQSHYDGCGFQLENKHPEEIQGNRTFDDEYNAQFISSLKAEGVNPPSVTELRTLLKTRNIDFGDPLSVTEETRNLDFGDSFDYNQLSLYVTSPWYRYSLAANSCPRTQNYGCRTVFHRMPCWRRWTTAGWHWCCPVWPGKIINRIAHCNCCSCAILSHAGAQCGECHRRYRRQRITAVCQAKQQSPYLISEKKWIPTSCYCRVCC